MGDVSIIARRLTDGHVQYGWSGNGGYYRIVGARLLEWYADEEGVDYLFSLGQTRWIGKRGSEKGGYGYFDTHCLTNEGFWMGKTEREIFSRICFIDYGYFYDTDGKWYYIVPGPFRIKMPLELVDENLDESGYEMDFLNRIENNLAKYILEQYIQKDSSFANLIKNNGLTPETILQNICSKGRRAMYLFYDEYPQLFSYFDDWILIKATDDNRFVEQIIMRPKTEKHIETIEWT